MRRVSVTVNRAEHALELDARELLGVQADGREITTIEASDTNGPAEYRRHLAKVLTRRAVEEAMSR